MLLDCGASRNFIDLDWVKQFVIEPKKIWKLLPSLEMVVKRPLNLTCGINLYISLIEKSRFVQFFV